MLPFYKMMSNKESGETILVVTKTKSQDKVLHYLLLNCQDKDTLTWYHTDETATMLANKCDMKKSFLNKILRQLVELGIVYKKTRGVYIVSKHFFQTKEDQNDKKK